MAGGIILGLQFSLRLDVFCFSGVAFLLAKHLFVKNCGKRYAEPRKLSVQAVLPKIGVVEFVSVCGRDSMYESNCKEICNLIDQASCHVHPAVLLGDLNVEPAFLRMTSDFGARSNQSWILEAGLNFP